MARTYQPVVLPSGFARQSTDMYHEGRYVNGDKVRSVGGVIETIGGWERLESGITLTGTCRGVKVWRALDDTKHIVMGTNCKLYHLQYGQSTLDDITPVRASGTLGTDPFTMTNTSAVVTVTHTSHGVQDSDQVTFSGATAAHGITIDGTYTATRVDSNSYTITHGSAATSSGTGGGASVAYSYEINCGLEDSADGLGFGIGLFGMETFGDQRSTSGALDVLLRTRVWHLWNYGEDLLALPWDGNLYLYDQSAGGVATLVANAPTNNVSMFVALERHVVVLGADDDRLKVAWSDIDDNTLWAAAASNQAGNFQLQAGSEILAGRPLRSGTNLLWTDTDAIRMVYLGRSPWFSFRSEGGGTGLIAPLASAEHDGIAYWMGNGNFYMFDGYAREIPNQADVENVVFADSGEGLDFQQRHKTFCFRLSEFREIWWFYQSYDSGDDIDRYVIYNIDERAFYTGTATRSAADEALIIGYPVMIAPTGEIYLHENGEDDDGSALRKYVRSSPFDVGDGLMNHEILGFWPDFDDVSGDLTLNLYTRDHPQGTARTEGPYTITSTTDVVDTRAAGRATAFDIESNTVGGKFRLGRIQLEVEPSGKRR